MSYDVVSLNENTYEVELEVEIFREGLGGGAQFDPNLRVGLYRKLNNNSYQHITTRNINIGGIEIDEFDFSDCGLTLSESQRAFYSTSFYIPNDDFDYMMVYQRCCRTVNISNIEQPQEHGFPLSVLITQEALISLNKSHKILNSSDRFLETSTPSSIVIDIEGDNQYVSEIVTPFSTGGSDGAGNSEGDPNGCTGVTPDPQSCPPPFAQVTLLSNINPESLFFESDDFSKESELEYQITAMAEGNYLISYYIHEYKDSVLMSSHYREQVYLVSNCDVVLNDIQRTLNNSFHLFPNPVADLLFIDVKEDLNNSGISIKAINGVEVHKIERLENNSIDVSELLPGVYFLEIQKGQRIEREKFIKS